MKCTIHLLLFLIYKSQNFKLATFRVFERHIFSMCNIAWCVWRYAALLQVTWEQLSNLVNYEPCKINSRTSNSRSALSITNITPHTRTPFTQTSNLFKTKWYSLIPGLSTTVDWYWPHLWRSRRLELTMSWPYSVRIYGTSMYLC